MKMTLIISTLFLSYNHPVSLIIIIMVTTLIMSSLIMNLLKSSWLTLIFILIMLGGLLILFIYIASLASNEPFQTHKMVYLIPFILLLPPFTMKSPKSIFSEENFMPLFSTSSSFNNHIAILYLLITLLVVIDTISLFKAPLRGEM